MIRGIIAWSLKFRFLVIAVAAGLIVFGILQLRDMPVDILPEFSPPYVEIQTESLGLSAEEVEQLITVPMEQDLLNGVPWLQTIRSESLPGLSSIVLIFEPGTDLIRARQMVSERLTQAVALPHVSKPPTMLQPMSTTGRAMVVGLSSKTLSLIQMSVLARWTIVPRLMGVPGVANVAIWGQRDRQLQVQVDPQRLKEHNVTLLDVLETTGNALWVSTLSFVEASTPGTGGFIDTSSQRLGVRHILPIVSPEGLAKVPIENTSLQLGDVANVVEDHQPLIGDALTGEGPSLLLVVEKFPGANTRDVTLGVEEALDNMRPGLPGMDMDTALYRPADFIDMAIRNVGMLLLLGLLLVLLVLVAFYFSWRSVLISLVAVPLSLIAGGLVLHLRGATMNALAVAGFVIALGVLIDDAIVDVEHVLQRLRLRQDEENAPAQSPGSQSAASIILDAALEMRSSLFYALLILLLAVAPLFFLGGRLGTFVEPLAESYVLALLASMLVAATVTPALCLILLAKEPPALREAPLMRWIRYSYQPLVAWMVGRGRLAAVAVALLTIAGLAVLPFLNRALLPAFKERNLLIHLDGVPGTSGPEMSRVAALVSADLRAIPGVSKIGAEVGRAVQGDQVVNVSSADLWVGMDPAADYDQTAAKIQTVIDGYPGIHHDVQTYLGEKSDEVAPEPGDSLTLRVYGNTADGLAAKAGEVKNAITAIGGVTAARVAYPVEQPALEIEVNLAAAQKYGIKPGDVRRAAATLLSGIQVGNLFEEQKVFEVVVWGTPAARNSINSVRNVQIDTPDGGYVRLGDVADVRMAPTASIIRHEAVSRYLDVLVSVQGRDLGAVAADINSQLRQMQFPLEFHAEVLGAYATQQAAQTRMLILALAAVIGAFFLLQAAYGSWRLAALACLTLPATLAGGLAAAYWGGALSLGSLGGLLAVLGIALRNQMLLIGHYRQLARAEGAGLNAELALRGAQERVIPTLITAFAVGLVMVLPLVLGDVPGLEFIRPMAIAVLGGLVTAGLVNLFFLPALCLSLRRSFVPEPEPAEAPLAGQGEGQGPILGTEGPGISF